MRKLALLILLSLISAIGIKAQSTDVSATVTDNAAQAWIGGTYTFKSLSPQQAPFTGLLDGAGSFTVTLPHNQFTQSVNDVWTFSACPDVSVPANGNGCFTSNVTIFGPTQSLTSSIQAIAPALTIPLFPAPIATIRAYNDAEIVSAPKGAQYYNVITPALRVCTTVGGTPTIPVCTAWANVGGGSGPGGTPRLDQVLDPNISKTFNLGTTTLSFINGAIDLSALTSAIKLPVIAGCTVASNGQICYDSTLGNWVVFNSSSSVIPTLLLSGTYTTGDVVGISNVAGKVTLVDLGPVNGSSGSSFVQITTTNIKDGDVVCWDAGTNGFINCTPGVPVTTISAASYLVDCANDRGSYLLFTSSSPIAVALPQASTSGDCDANFFTFIRTLHATLTVTPTVSTIDDGGGAGATLDLSPGYGFTITSDNTNYTARGGPYRESGNPLMSVEGFDVNTLGGYDWQSPNNASPGTVLNKMACDDGTGKLQTCAFATAATNNPVGVATTGIGAAPGTTGNTAICFIGFCKVFFDNAATANHFAQLSTTVNGDLHDTGLTTPPTNGQPYWYVFAANSGANTVGTVRDLSPSELSAVAVNGGGKSTILINGSNTQPRVNFTTSGGLTLTPTDSGNTTTVAFTLSGSGVTNIATTGPITGGPITTTGTIACATCVTAASALTSGQILAGGGGQAIAVSNLTGDVTTSGSMTTTLGSAFKQRGLSFSIGIPGGSALTAASTTTDYLTVPFACTISAYNLNIDAGTITVKFWKVATGTAIPTSGNSINTSGVGISSGTAIHSTTVSDFTTTTVTANDIMAMNVTAVATAAFVNGVLQCGQ